MRIVRCRYGAREAFEAIPGFVYCGRKYGGYECSFLHNPFRVGRDGTLAEVIAKFRKHLMECIEEGSPVTTTLQGLDSNAVLGCWCCEKTEDEVLDTPKGQERCHAEVILKAWFYLEGLKDSDA